MPPLRLLVGPEQSVKQDVSLNLIKACVLHVSYLSYQFFIIVFFKVVSTLNASNGIVAWVGIYSLTHPGNKNLSCECITHTS